MANAVYERGRLLLESGELDLSVGRVEITMEERRLVEMQDIVNSVMEGDSIFPFPGQWVHIERVSGSTDTPHIEYTGPVFGVAMYDYTLTPGEIAFPEFMAEEDKARELLKSLQPEAYAEYKATKFKHLYYASSIFPVIYGISYRGISVYQSPNAFSLGGICVAPGRHHSESPDTDNVLTLYLMLKWNEESVLRVGNWDSSPIRKAWWVLCWEYKRYALRYYALRLRQRVSAVLSFCTSRKR